MRYRPPPEILGLLLGIVLALGMLAGCRLLWSAITYSRAWP